MAGCLLELFLFVGIDVRPVTFRKPVSENGADTPPKKDDCSIAA